MASPRPMSLKDTKTLESITRDLESPISSNNCRRRFGDPAGAYMQLTVERVGESTYSLAHYYTQNGDAMRDPEVVFFRSSDGHWFPLSFQQDGIRNPYRRALKLDPHAETIVSWWPRVYSDLRSFVLVWLRNLRCQQGIS